AQRRVPVLRVERRGDAGAGDGADQPAAETARPRGTVPADGEPRPEGAGVRDPGAVGGVPRPRRDAGLEAAGAAEADGGGAGEEGGGEGGGGPGGRRAARAGGVARRQADARRVPAACALRDPAGAAGEVPRDGRGLRAG